MTKRHGINFTNQELEDLAAVIAAAGGEGEECPQTVIEKIADEADRRGIEQFPEPYGRGTCSVSSWRRSARTNGY